MLVSKIKPCMSFYLVVRAHHTINSKSCDPHIRVEDGMYDE
jgi:hypothetical protein